MLFNEERANKLMREHKIDALIVSCPRNIYYFSGFEPLHECMPERRMCVVFPLDGSPTIIFRPHLLSLYHSYNCWPEHIKVFGESGLTTPENLPRENLSLKERRLLEVVVAQGAKKLTYEEALIDVLRKEGLVCACLGLDEQSLKNIDKRISETILKAKIEQADDLIAKIRWVKTSEEIGLMRKAANINEEALLETLGEVKVGRTEIDLWRIYKASVLEKGGQPRFSNILGGTRGALLDDLPGDYSLMEGDPLRIDPNCTYKYYWSDIGRTASVGKPSQKFLKYFNALYRGLQETREEVRPGIKVSTIHRRAIDAVRRAGVPDYDIYYIGHAIGLNCYDGLVLGPEEDTLLEEGMTINIELAYSEIGLGTPHVEDTVLVTKKGFESLVSLSMELYQIFVR